jgi:hypothetical protein
LAGIGGLVVAVAPGLFYRHLTIVEVLEKVRSRSNAEVARHNATVIDLGERRDLHREVLQIFVEARRLRRLGR